MRIIVLIGLLIAMTQADVSAQSKTDKLLRHVVLFKFKDESSASDVERIQKAFSALPSKIKEIAGYEWGLNNSTENLNQGFTHCFFVSFRSEKDRAVYLPHPEHQKFVEVLKPHLHKVLVIDYWTNIN